MKKHTKNSLSEIISTKNTLEKSNNKYQIGKKTKIDYYYCHHCKQRKPAEFSIKCKSSLTEAKYCQRPFKTTVINGTTIIRSKLFYIIFIYLYIGHKCLIIKGYDGETKEFQELLAKLEKNLECHRYYCYFCLKGSYDTLTENIKDNNSWLCPYCTGACYCTRCMRNEKLLQLIGYYFSIDGNICELYDELIPLNSIIDKLLRRIL